MPARRAPEAVRPTRCGKIRDAGGLVGKTALELRQRTGKVDHDALQSACSLFVLASQTEPVTTFRSPGPKGISLFPNTLWTYFYGRAAQDIRKGEELTCNYYNVWDNLLSQEIHEKAYAVASGAISILSWRAEDGLQWPVRHQMWAVPEPEG